MEMINEPCLDARQPLACCTILSFVAIGGFENDGIVLFLFQQWTNAQDGLKFDMIRSRCWFRRSLSTSAACRHSLLV